MRLRSQWKPVSKYIDPDFHVFPRERLGRHYDLNWEICKYAVIPSVEGNAFRNLHTRGLLMYAKGTTDNAKAVQLNVPDNELAFKHFVLPPAKPAKPTPDFVDITALPAEGVINDSQTRAAAKEVRRFLSEGPAIFVHDGALGSDPASELKLRFITDSADTGLYLRSVIPRVPSVGPQEFQEDITVFSATGLKFDTAALGLGPSSSGSFVIVNLQDRKVYIGGTRALDAVEQALSAIATYSFAAKGGLPFPGEAIVPSNGRPFLLASPSGPVHSADLFGAHLQLWNDRGLSRVFNGAAFAEAPATPKRGDLVQTTAKGRKVILPLKTGSNAGQPAAVVFLGKEAAKGKPSIAKISAEEAAKQYLASFPFPLLVQQNLLRDRFLALVRANNIATYQVSAGKGKVDYSELQKLLQ